VCARLGLAPLAGLTLDAAFPGRGLWFAAPLALAVLFLLLTTSSVRLGGAIGFLFGLGFFVPHVSWSGIYVGALPWLALATLEATFVAVFGAATSLAGRWLGPSAHLLTAPLLWVGAEGLRSRTPFGGFPWGRVAFSQVDGPALGWAWLGGAPMVTLVVAFSGSLLAIGTRGLLVRRGQRPWRRLARLAASVTMAAGVLAAGVPLLATTRESADTSVNVAAIQGNVAQPGLDFNAERRAVLRNHVSQTLLLAEDVREGRERRPDVVLWPENSSDIDPTRDAQAASDITRATRALGVPVVIGAVLAEPEPRVSNATLVWSPLGAITDRYVKNRPVPFAEYVPFRGLVRSITATVDLVRKDFAPGRGPHTVDAGAIRLGVGICFEVAFDDHLRSAVADGAQLLFVPTNNATFGRTDESVQQLAMSRLRAVELGRSVAHVSTVGVSGLIRPDGSFAAKGGHFTAERLTATLPLSQTRTPAMRVGGPIEGAIAAAGLGIPVLGFARTRLARQRPLTREQLMGRQSPE
jgi:apolipoprotein N-acyltransferase